MSTEGKRKTATTHKEFILTAEGSSQWGAVVERLGKTVEALEYMNDALLENGLYSEENPGCDECGMNDATQDEDGDWAPCEDCQADPFEKN